MLYSRAFLNLSAEKFEAANNKIANTITDKLRKETIKFNVESVV